jgi:predicted transcriptional regulator
MKRLTIWIDEKTLAKLKRIAKKEDRSVGWLLRKAAEGYSKNTKSAKQPVSG